LGMLVEFGYRYELVDSTLEVDIPELLSEQYSNELSAAQFKDPNIIGLLDLDCVKNKLSGKSIKLRTVFESVLARVKDKLKNIAIPTDILTLSWQYDLPNLCLDLPLGKYDITKIEVKFKFSEYWEKEAEAYKNITYSDGEKNIMNVTEFKIKNNTGEENTYTFHQDVRTGTSKFIVENKKTGI
ncbi:MAG: hypothetical protein ACO1G9_05820, partial [Bacteroidota bacterium]